MDEISQVTKKFQLWQNQLELNNDLYLQIEQFYKKEKEIYNKKNIIAVKYSLGDKDDEKYDEKVKISSEIRNKIYEELKEGLMISGEAFFWNKNENLLYGVEDGSVTVKRGDELYISGEGFIANTLSKEFEFLNSIADNVIYL